MDYRVTSNLLFQDVRPSVVERVAPRIHLTKVSTDTVLFEKGAEADGVYLVLEGGVRASGASGEGRQVTLGFIEAGDFFGELAVLEGTPRSARVTVTCPSILGHLTSEDLTELIRLAPAEVAANLSRAAVRRVRAMNDRHIDETLRAERLSVIGQMAASIVHDLKDPIGVVRHVAALLADPLDALPPDRMAGMLRRSADQMLGMVQDILAYSRGGVTISLQLTSISALVGDLEEQLLAALRRQGVEVRLTLDYGGELMADRRALLRALLNIMKNAGEAMPDGGTLSVKFVRSAQNVVITIEDTGAGIPADVLPSIFEPFKSHGKPGGTGLGMAITKSTIDAHRGTIDVESRLGSGTTFIIVLPLSNAARA